MSAAAMFLMNLLDDITFFLIERKVSLSHHSISIWEILFVVFTRLELSPLNVIVLTCKVVMSCFNEKYGITKTKADNIRFGLSPFM
jgi:hypothetical protein